MSNKIFRVSYVQAQHWIWIKNQPFWNEEWMDPFIGIVEELGELAHALLKQKQGIRGTREEHEAKAKDAIGDIFIYMLDLCNRRGWNLEQIFNDTWEKVSKRDWTTDPQAGGETE